MEIIFITIVCFTVFVCIIKYSSIELVLWLKSSKPNKNTHYKFVKKVYSDYSMFLDKRNNKEYLFKTSEEIDFNRDVFYMYMPQKVLLGFGYLGSPIIKEYNWRAVEFFG